MTFQIFGTEHLYPLVDQLRANGLPFAVTARLNVDHLSNGLDDCDYLWRSSLDGSLIKYELLKFGIPGWFRHIAAGCWDHIASTAVEARPGERFIRVGEVI